MTNGERDNGLGRAFGLAKGLSAFFTVTPFLYAGVVEYLSWNQAPFNGFVPGFNLALFLPLLSVVGLTEVALSWWMPGRILSGKVPTSPTGPQAAWSGSVQRLFQANLVAFSILESIAVYGLMLFLVGGHPWHFYAFASVSLILMLIRFPRKALWDEALAGMTENNRGVQP